ncbi:MAG TPA: RDD family protein [Chitinophagales bacterium]|nr:RDD family protein [Chitinophagales bacterium]
MVAERYRTGLKRLQAAIVDGILFSPFLVVDRWIANSTVGDYVIIGWETFTIFIPIFYSIISHYKFGQTLGKWVAGVKVLDISETRNITLRQSFFRDGFYLLVELAGFFYYLTLVLLTGETGYLLINFNSFANTPFFIWTLFELITLLTNNKRRAIHDFLAKSVVIRTE